MGVKALAKAEAASERADGTHQFRLLAGYSALVQWLVSQLEQIHAVIHYRMRVEELLWEMGNVEARVLKWLKSLLARLRTHCSSPGKQPIMRGIKGPFRGRSPAGSERRGKL